MPRFTTEQLVTRMGFANQWAPEYTDHVRSVKGTFLREEHPELLVGPQALEASTGSLATWENALNRLYERYPEQWNPVNFDGNLAQRRGFANFFLVAQAKKARSDAVNEERKAAAATAAAAARASRSTGSYPQKARGRKRAPSESSTNRASWPLSLPAAAAKRVKIVERPELTFRSFAVLLKDRENPPAISYDDVWQFEDLIKWILAKNPSLSGKRILCWSEIVFNDSDYAEMMGIEVGTRRPRMITNQGSWVACILAAQANRSKPDRFPGICIKVALESDHQNHDADDVIDLGSDDKRVDGAADTLGAGNAGTEVVSGGGDVGGDGILGAGDVSVVGDVSVAGGEKPAVVL